MRRFDRAGLADLIQQLEKFTMAADMDRELERRTLQQWQEAQKLEAKVDRRELGSLMVGLWMERPSRSYVLNVRQVKQKR